MKGILYIFFSLYSFCLFAQTPMLSNQGTLFSVKGDAFVSVHGDCLNDNSGTFHNSNEMYLFGDWENNASNEAFVSTGEGVVHMQGDVQYIQGSSITRFYDLRMENTGVKYADIDVYVDGFLNLNDREFNLDTNTTHVFNTDLTSVQHSQLAGTWGFVSSLGNGGLLRHTNDTTPYFFPVGSTQGTSRFRPVNISPDSSSLAAFKVRLANTDPTTEGWDRSLSSFKVCEVNPNFFHRITRTVGTQSAVVEMFFDVLLDGDFSDIGKWVNTNMWDEASAGVASFNATYSLDTRTSIKSISDFSPNAFALTKLSPDILLSVDPVPICSDQFTVLTASTIDSSSFNSYDFFVDNILVHSGNSGSFVLNNPNVGDLPIWVEGTLTGCGSTSDTVMLTVLEAVVANAYSDTIIVEGTSASLLATGGDFYNWMPDTALSCNICAATDASPLQTTSYSVEVENMDGCKDTATVLVEVRESVDNILFIPNVLTPNNDGFNDTWFVKNIDLFPKNAVKIISRWGDVVFSTNNYQNNWSGTYGSGLLPAGTYYYILDLGGSWGVFKGDVTILRE